MFKYFIGCDDDSEKFIPLCIMLPKMNVYRVFFEETKYVSFSATDNQLLEKYERLDNEIVYKNKSFKTKIKSY